jgi:hypothetical protein
MLAPPSLVHDYSLVFSGDPALDAPDERASEPEVREWQEKLARARETGQWDSLLKPGQEPTRFVMRQLTGSQRRELMDLLEDSSRGGGMGKTAILFRAAVKRVDNLGATEVKHHRDPETGLSFKIATPEIVNVLDDISMAIVGELATEVARRLQGVTSPKS